jgi:hypothetical protein
MTANSYYTDYSKKWKSFVKKSSTKFFIGIYSASESIRYRVNIGKKRFCTERILLR